MTGDDPEDRGGSAARYTAILAEELAMAAQRANLPILAETLRQLWMKALAERNNAPPEVPPDQ